VVTNTAKFAPLEATVRSQRQTKVLSVLFKGKLQFRYQAITAPYCHGSTAPFDMFDYQ
jgi:hypothetical protein